MTEIKVLEKKISALLEEKDITIQDDYFYDIFNVGETLNEIFRVKSPRFMEPIESNIIEYLNEIITNLEKYRPLNNQQLAN